MFVADATDRLTTLTTRERQIALAVADGRSNRDIAGHLRISEQTVKNHLTSIFEKMGVTSRLQLALTLVKDRDRGDRADRS
jgi:DNA-binding NarL/FixJ family response regulator